MTPAHTKAASASRWRRSPSCWRTTATGTAAVAGIHERAAAKLAEVDATFVDLTTMRAALAAGVEAGCDDLTACTENP
ncbi:hypothetical protein ACODT5_08620 [Streptomyces sp. 5.8]|uniref:hypothetical protein n=1 Tax=Streptomyces sp. 5.8 TaxID=3406571 RepID=UPI003BB59EDC